MHRQPHNWWPVRTCHSCTPTRRTATASVSPCSSAKPAPAGSCIVLTHTALRKSHTLTTLLLSFWRAARRRRTLLLHAPCGRAARAHTPSVHVNAGAADDDICACDGEATVALSSCRAMRRSLSLRRASRTFFCFGRPRCALSSASDWSCAQPTSNETATTFPTSRTSVPTLALYVF